MKPEAQKFYELFAAISDRWGVTLDAWDDLEDYARATWCEFAEDQ